MAELTDDQLALLDEIYFDKGIAVGRDKLFYFLNYYYQEFGITKRQVEYYLKRNPTHQINSRQYQSVHIKSILAKRPYDILQMDLIDYSNKQAQNFRYILTVIDVFSRYAWTKRITAKTDDKVVAALKSILESMGNVPIKRIMSDHGSEFNNALMKELLDEHDIKHILGIAGLPEVQGIIERFNGSLKSLLDKYQQINGRSWTRNLKYCTEIYNKTLHSSLQMTPEMALHLDNDGRRELYKRMKSKGIDRAIKKVVAQSSNAQVDLKVGDKVRLKIRKGKLDKYSVNNWTEELYKVIKITNPRHIYNVERYTIEDENGNVLKKRVREDLLKVEV